MAFALLAACACAGRLPPAPAAPVDDRPVRIDRDLSVRRVAPDAYVITHDTGLASNVLVARMPDGTLVICSSPFDTEVTRAMVRWLRAAFAPARMVAINPHFHPDGTAGNEAYADGGVETHATAETQGLVVARGAQTLAESAALVDDPAAKARIQATRVVPAANVIDLSRRPTFTIGGEPVQVIFPGPAHAPDNVVVHFPARRLLFGGCMIKTGKTIGYTGDAVMDAWEASVRALEPLDVAVVVPGHGRTGGPELLRNTVEVVRAAREKR
jgi:metallo-beta-lactamase class B